MTTTGSKHHKAPRLHPGVGLLLLWVAVIWGHSLMPGSASTEESGIVVELLRPSLVPMPFDVDTLTFIVRKIAHISEFAILGILSRNAWRELPIWISIATGIVVASVDETIQLFVPERLGSVQDVAIDLFGFFLGLIVFGVVGHFLRQKHRPL